MNWMEFTAALVGHLAWPTAIVAVVAIFRRPLAALISDLSEGEAGPSGIKFKRAWRRTADAVSRSHSPSARRLSACLLIRPSSSRASSGAISTTCETANLPDHLRRRRAVRAPHDWREHRPTWPP